MPDESCCRAERSKKIRHGIKPPPGIAVSCLLLCWRSEFPTGTTTMSQSAGCLPLQDVGTREDPRQEKQITPLPWENQPFSRPSSRMPPNVAPLPPPSACRIPDPEHPNGVRVRRKFPPLFALDLLQILSGLSAGPPRFVLVNRARRGCAVVHRDCKQAANLLSLCGDEERRSPSPLPRREGA